MTESKERTRTGTADEYHGSGTMFIDIAPSMVVKKGKRKETVREKPPRGIIIKSQLDSDRKAILKVMKNSFNSRELSALSKYKKLEIIVDPDLEDAPGDYMIEKNIVRVRPNSVFQSTIIHEIVHALRWYDVERTDPVTTSRGSNSDPDDRNLEEAATVAEMVIRLNPYVRVEYVSYYSKLESAETQEDAYEMMDEDRELFVGNSTEGAPGLKGKNALRSLNKNFDKSNIGELKMGTDKTAKEYGNELKKKEINK